VEKVKISDSCRPGEVAKRFGELFVQSHDMVTAAEEVEKTDFNEKKCTEFILKLLRVRYQ